MDRRKFLWSSAAAATALGVAGCNGGGGPEAPQLPGSTGFPTPTFITSDPKFSDYRPTVDATGTQVLFERTPVPDGGAFTLLYIAKAVGTASQSVAAFLPPPPPNPSAAYPFSQTRPDWSWVTGLVAFNGAPANASPDIQAHICAADGGGLRLVPGTVHHLYPIWASDGAQLVIYDNNANVAQPGPPAIAPPLTRLVRPDGSVVVANLNGLGSNGVQVFGGFAAPKPGNTTQIAFAGQPAVVGWAGNTDPKPFYGQDYNYIYLNAFTGGVYSSAPLEAGASIASYAAAFQGRAPYWSPDGNYLVFESSRAGGYALFLANLAKGTAPQQLTHPFYWAQHAKFFPGGKSIVFTALQQQSSTGAGPRGIATLDITDHL